MKRRHSIRGIAATVGAVLLPRAEYVGGGQLLAATIRGTADVPAIHPDAELLELSAYFLTLDRQLDALGAGMTLAQEKASGVEAERDALHDQQSELAERVSLIHASTLEGLQAKARVAEVYRPFDTIPTEEYLAERCRMSVLRDLMELRS